MGLVLVDIHISKCLVTLRIFPGPTSLAPGLWLSKQPPRRAATAPRPYCCQGPPFCNPLLRSLSMFPLDPDLNSMLLFGVGGLAGSTFRWVGACALRHVFVFLSGAGAVLSGADTTMLMRIISGQA
jgi:hypothetical protein